MLEHPEASHAWTRHGLNHPPKSGGWIAADLVGGWTCCVEQGHYGHRARKATWLYAYGLELPSLMWGRAMGKARLDEGYHSAAERRRGRNSGPTERLSARQRAATPTPFRDVLIAMARTADVRREASA